jgi:hypothetical protein
LSDQADEVLLEFSGQLTISGVCEARDSIAAGLARGRTVILDVDAIAETDLTFIQLIESARRKAGEAGRALRLRRPAEGAILEVLQRGGFLDDGASDRARFWLEGAAS